jgi:hypothetical protein
MRTIWKYTLDHTDEQTIQVPKNFTVMSTGDVDGQCVLWAMVDSEAETIPVRVRMFGTGNPVDLPGRWRFMGTVQQPQFAWHIFIELPEQV